MAKHLGINTFVYQIECAHMRAAILLQVMDGLGRHQYVSELWEHLQLRTAFSLMYDCIRYLEAMFILDVERFGDCIGYDMISF